VNSQAQRELSLQKSGRIPSLDGLRAVSILMVVLLHTLQRFQVSRYWYLFGNGATGVYIFFVISGFLITSLLLREHGKYGTICLKSFYLRRGFRILPPAYAYVAFVGILVLIGKLTISRSNVFSALFFYSDYTDQAWVLQHFWTLAIEEQFYLIWPLVLMLCLKYRGRSAAIKVSIAVILICPLIRIATYLLDQRFFHHHTSGGNFQGRADSLMFGCLVAMLSGSSAFERVYTRASRFWWLYPIILLFFSGALEIRFGDYWDYPIGYTLNGICIAMFLLWCVRNPASFVGKCLNWTPVVQIGVLSYGIYIWQQVFLNPHNGSVFGSAIVDRFPFSYLALILTVLTSYFLVEQPSLRLRDRVESCLGLSRKSRERTVTGGRSGVEAT
jgi:peptidoglycan/LPS O-acetylase OafA/YrhL